MRFIKLSRIISLACVLLLAAPAWADEDKTDYYLTEGKGRELQPAFFVKSQLPEYQRRFIEQYEQVKKTQDEDILASLVHPASKACETDENTDYFHHLRVFYLTEELAEDYNLKLVKVAEDKQWSLQLRTGMPLPPTHVMYMEYRSKSGQVEGLQRFLREETEPEPRMYELVKCPDEATLRQFRESK